MQPVIKWSGSKRLLAKSILPFFPDSYNCYYEPFLGGGSILYAVNSPNSICGDICKPLIDLWKTIRDNPEELAQSYKENWEKLQKEGYLAYYEIRDHFNLTKSPFDFLFLSRTCVNGLIRFNKNGEFNNSLHYSRPGINPQSLKKIIFDWSKCIKNVKFYAEDYKYTTMTAEKGDIIYLDPPYFNTKGRYFGKINFDEFFNYLEMLNVKGIKYILSFDGLRGDKNYTADIPKELYKRHEYLCSGNSTFKKIIDKKNEKVMESVYLNY